MQSDTTFYTQQLSDYDEFQHQAIFSSVDTAVQIPKSLPINQVIGKIEGQIFYKGQTKITYANGTMITSKHIITAAHALFHNRVIILSNGSKRVIYQRAKNLKFKIQGNNPKVYKIKQFKISRTYLRETEKNQLQIREPQYYDFAVCQLQLPCTFLNEQNIRSQVFNPEITSQINAIIKNSINSVSIGLFDKENVKNIYLVSYTPSQNQLKRKNDALYLTKIQNLEICQENRMGSHKYNTVPGQSGSPYLQISQDGLSIKIIGIHIGCDTLNRKPIFNKCLLINKQLKQTVLKDIFYYDLTDNQSQVSHKVKLRCSNIQKQMQQLLKIQYSKCKKIEVQNQQMLNLTLQKFQYKNVPNNIQQFIRQRAEYVHFFSQISFLKKIYQLEIALANQQNDLKQNYMPLRFEKKEFYRSFQVKSKSTMSTEDNTQRQLNYKQLFQSLISGQDIQKVLSYIDLGQRKRKSEIQYKRQRNLMKQNQKQNQPKQLFNVQRRDRLIKQGQEKNIVCQLFGYSLHKK